MTSPFEIEYIEGDKLWSSAGITNYFYNNVNYSTNNKPPFEIDDTETFGWVASAPSVTFPPRSVSVLQFNASGVLGLDETTQNDALFQLYPTPTNTGNDITLAFHQPTSGLIQVYDAVGNLCYEEQVNAASSVALPTVGLAAGSYAVSFTHNDYRHTQPMLLVH